MANYTGSKCISCGEVFKDDDDVVVCADCGTPYHRDCYLKEGKCINEELHEKGQTWKAQAETKSEDTEESVSTRCIRCGYENPPEKLFCEKCGTPLMKTGDDSRPFNSTAQNGADNGTNNFAQGMGGANGQGMPFGQQMVFDKNSEIDGIKLDDYAKYVGGNPLGFLSSFIRFSKFGGKCSLNIFAFLFPEVYFLFRKMKTWGIAALLLSAILSIPTTIEYFTTGAIGFTLDLGIDIKTQAFTMISYGAGYINIALKILAGLFANYLYFKQAKKDINEIRNSDTVDDEETVKGKIAGKGGTSWASVIVGFTVYIVIMFGSVMGLSRIM